MQRSLFPGICCPHQIRRSPVGLAFCFETYYRMLVHWFLDLFVLDMSVRQHQSYINHAYTCIILTFRYSCCIFCHISLFVISCYWWNVLPQADVCVWSLHIESSPIGRKCLSFLHYSPLSYVLVDDFCFSFLPNYVLGWNYSLELYPHCVESCFIVSL